MLEVREGAEKRIRFASGGVGRGAVALFLVEARPWQDKTLENQDGSEWRKRTGGREKELAEDE